MSWFRQYSDRRSPCIAGSRQPFVVAVCVVDVVVDCVAFFVVVVVTIVFHYIILLLLLLLLLVRCTGQTACWWRRSFQSGRIVDR